MIDVAKVRANIAAMPGDLVALSKQQVAELLDEIEQGRTDRRVVSGIRSIFAIAGVAEGARA